MCAAAIDIETLLHDTGEYSLSFCLHDPEFDGHVYRLNLLVGGVLLDLFSPKAKGRAVVEVAKFRFSSPLAALLDITRMFHVEADHSVPAPLVSREVLKQAAEVSQRWRFDCV